MEKKKIRKIVYLVCLFILFKVLYDIISNPSDSIEAFKRGYDYVMQIIR